MDSKELIEAAHTLQAVKPLLDTSSNLWVPAIAAVSGAFIGAVAGFIPAYLIEKYRERAQKKKIQKALTAEVSAFVEIIKARRYIESVAEIIQRLRADPSRMERYVVKVPDRYAEVYKSNLSNIGLIDSTLLLSVIEFHQLIDAAVQDVMPGGLLAEKGGNASSFEELHGIMRRGMELGENIVAEYA